MQGRQHRDRQAPRLGGGDEGPGVIAIIDLAFVQPCRRIILHQHGGGSAGLVHRLGKYRPRADRIAPDRGGIIQGV